MATATVPAALSSDLQTLIDSRLDSIDRMLVGQVPRPDRLAIVREVEVQIHDLLAERGHADLDRRDILDVLARLDPPEAYLGDVVEGPGRAGTPTLRTALPRVPARPATAATLLGKTAGILGVTSGGLVLLFWACLGLEYFVGADSLIYAGAAADVLGLMLAVVAISLSSADRFANGWSIAGIALGASSLATGLCSLAVFAFLYFS